MTFLIDANVLLYTTAEGPYREPCLEILDAVGRGSADGRASTAVLEEVWHVEVSGKAPNLAGLTRRLYRVLSPLLPVDDEAFGRALGLDAPRLETNDRIHAGTCLVHDIGVIVSADRGFDGVKGIRRVDPLDERALRRLLGSSR